MFDLNVPEQFVAFYHTGTLIEVAKELHISQSTLTRSIQKLESEFGVAFFKRAKNSITLTEVWKIAAVDAEMILHQCENMLLMQVIGFWYDLVKEKIPDYRFLMQTDLYNFMELAANSRMPFLKGSYFQIISL